MTRVTLDSATLGRLNPGDTVEVCDETVVVVGVYYPLGRLSDSSNYELFEPKLTDEEWRRRAEEPGGRRLVEILADLHKRS